MKSSVSFFICSFLCLLMELSAFDNNIVIHGQVVNHTDVKAFNNSSNSGIILQTNVFNGLTVNVTSINDDGISKNISMLHNGLDETIVLTASKEDLKNVYTLRVQIRANWEL